MNVGGGPTPDKPSVTLSVPDDPDRFSSFLNIRVADIQACYKLWKSRGAGFITEPRKSTARFAARCAIPTVTSSRSANPLNRLSIVSRCAGTLTRTIALVDAISPPGRDAQDGSRSRPRQQPMQLASRCPNGVANCVNCRQLVSSICGGRPRGHFCGASARTGSESRPVRIKPCGSRATQSRGQSVCGDAPAITKTCRMSRFKVSPDDRSRQVTRSRWNRPLVIIAPLPNAIRFRMLRNSLAQIARHSV